ncbi:hypothetical protein GCM10012275_60170 [Longimycelium tulufanense]|uniref:Uncharacterized protein n=1 Tax=Longimycelium tulufanense TaxID=907463 RepID=A0A8J3CEE9_9PSEU|nr:hypothetical protein [Longimycelium tulufanense]GGM81471.1 hypothetical protein GCM10012275_60170 [Longimycelium tulufanense]
MTGRDEVDPDLVRAVLERVGGLHPAVAEAAPITKLPGVDEPWLSVTSERVDVDVVVHSDALPALPRLLAARRELVDALGIEVELHVVDVVERSPDADARGDADERAAPV